MITDRLYYDDAYLTEFDAHVICVRADGWIALDRSAFYPTSGGQPYDTGVLETDRETVHVTDVQVDKDVVWHCVDKQLHEGQRVHGRIDWARRFEHMQQHAADHMLAGAAWELYGGVTIGLHLGREDSTIDMELPGGRTRLTAEETDTLEALVNARVQRDDLIQCWFPSPRELEGLPLRKRPTVAAHVRVVAMGDYEMVACGGTHPSTTGQIGPVKILDCTPAHGKMRLRFVAGMRAVRYLQRAVRCADAVASALSGDIDNAAELLQQERDHAAEERRELRKNLTNAAIEMVLAKGKDGIYAAHLPFADRETLLRVSSEVTRDPQATVLLSCPQANGSCALVFGRGSAVETDMAALLRASGARGGGKPDLAQGSAQDEGAPQRAYALLCK
ncbi:MAG: hypothetical protein IK133_04615 [Clostridia bacterium]|nr:hypothetical protein [Clostridia bacterium]